jgi:peptidyl-prolyl cis-trans isomerase D
MLTALRSKASSWVVKFLLGLLMISFAVWGVGDFLRDAGEKESAVASVGGDDVMASELRQRLNSIIGNLTRQSGVTIDSVQAKRYGLDQMALNQLIEDRVYSAYGAKLGLRVPLDLIKQRITSFPEFRNQLGQFDPVQFQQMLRNNDMSEAQFTETFRISTIRSFIVGSIGNGIGAPKTMAEALYASRGEQRVAKTVLIPDSSITEQFTPDDATLKKFHETNSGNYQAPEYRSVTLVRLDPESLVGQIAVGDDEIAQAYEAEKAKYLLPETRDIDTVAYPDQAAAKAAFDLLKQGRTLADVAQTGGKTVEPRPGLTLEALTQTIGEEAAKTIFAAKQGVATDPIETPNGWVIAQTTKVTPARQQSLEEVKVTIKHDLALLQAQDQILEIGDQFEDQRGGGLSLEEAAAAVNLPVTKIPATDSAGRDEAGTVVPGVAQTQNLLQIIQSTEEGRETRLEDGGNGVYFALRVDKITAAATRPLEKVRDKVVADWQASKRREAAAAKAQELAQRIQGGETLEKVAAEIGSTVQASEPFTRRTSDPTAGLSPALVSKAFELKVGDVASGRAGSGDGEVLIVLSEIQPVDLSKRSVEIADLRENLQNQIADDMAAELSSAMRSEIGVTIDQAVIDTLF